MSSLHRAKDTKKTSSSHTKEKVRPIFMVIGSRDFIISKASYLFGTGGKLFSLYSDT